MTFNLFRNKAKHTDEQWDYKTMFGPKMSFAVMESYKLLRTNIAFSFPEDGMCRVIGVTSAVQSEGKSTTSCNTAYALSESGARVLLLDADLRKPSVAQKLQLARSPGLSNLLVSRWNYQELIQHCSLAPNLDIITSGDIPPNPSELLSSDRMGKIIEELSKVYDYIILDLPPVTIVSDAVAVSKWIQGIVLVVRKGISNRQMLAETLRQLKLVNIRVLGFVFRDSGKTGGSYSRKYRYKYYSDYGRKVKHTAHPK